MNEFPPDLRSVRDSVEEPSNLEAEVESWETAGDGLLEMPLEEATDSFREFLESKEIKLREAVGEVPILTSEIMEEDEWEDDALSPTFDIELPEGGLGVQVRQYKEPNADVPDVDEGQVRKLLREWGKSWLERKMKKAEGAEPLPESLQLIASEAEEYYRAYFRNELGIEQPLAFSSVRVWKERPDKEGGFHGILPGYYDEEKGRWVGGGFTFLKKDVPQAIDPDYAKESKASKWLEAHARSPVKREIPFASEEEIKVDIPGLENPVDLHITPDNAWKWYVQYKTVFALTHEMVHETRVPEFSLEFEKGEDGSIKFKQFKSFRSGAVTKQYLGGGRVPSFEEGIVEFTRKKATEAILKKHFPEAYAYQHYLTRACAERENLAEGEFRIFHVDPRVEKNGGNILVHTTSLKYEGGVRMVEYLQEVMEEEGFNFEALAHASRLNSKGVMDLARALKEVFGRTKVPDGEGETKEGTVLALLYSANEDPEDEYSASKVIEALKKLREERKIFLSGSTGTSKS